MLEHPETNRVDPLVADVERVWRDSGKRYGSRKVKAALLNILEREFDGYAPHTHIDLADRSIAGHAVGPVRDAAFVLSAFATLRSPLDEIEVFHTDRGSQSGQREDRRDARRVRHPPLPLGQGHALRQRRGGIY